MRYFPIRIQKAAFIHAAFYQFNFMP